MITVCTLHVAPVIPSSAAIASMPIYNVTKSLQYRLHCLPIYQFHQLDFPDPGYLHKQMQDLIHLHFHGNNCFLGFGSLRHD